MSLLQTVFPVEVVRRAFPALDVLDEGRTRIYFDSPAGTQVPLLVMEAVLQSWRDGTANTHGVFSTSMATERIFDDAHRAMAVFLGAQSEREIVIGQSMTALTFQFARSLGRLFNLGDEIVISDMEHDANVAPWLAMAKECGLVVRRVPFDHETWRIEPSALESVLSEKTRLVALNYASNLLGSINDVAALSARAKAAGALVYVDAVQYAPHRLTDVCSLQCDFLVCSAYKFYGPHVGVLWAREELLRGLYVYKPRPSPAALPRKFEIGTPQFELFAGLSATIAYFASLGRQFGAQGGERDLIAAAFEAVERWETQLVRRLVAGLQEIPGITIYGITDPNQFAARVPTVSFKHARHPSTEIVKSLAEQSIFAWSGNYYAIDTVKSLGIDTEDGLVRLGLAQYATPEEIDRVLSAVAEITQLR